MAYTFVAAVVPGIFQLAAPAPCRNTIGGHTPTKPALPVEITWPDDTTDAKFEVLETFRVVA